MRGLVPRAATCGALSGDFCHVFGAVAAEVVAPEDLGDVGHWPGSGGRSPAKGARIVMAISFVGMAYS
jgi:hypothetical protein